MSLSRVVLYREIEISDSLRFRVSLSFRRAVQFGSRAVLDQTFQMPLPRRWQGRFRVGGGVGTSPDILAEPPHFFRLDLMIKGKQRSYGIPTVKNYKRMGLQIRPTPDGGYTPNICAHNRPSSLVLILSVQEYGVNVDVPSSSSSLKKIWGMCPPSTHPRTAPACDV